MPKSLDKTKGAPKRKPPAANAPATDGDAGAGPVRKKKKVQKRSQPDDGIEMSKQLAGKVKKARTSRPATRSAGKNSAPRVCGNGVPMPSLTDLEKMYEDSDYDTDTDQKPTIAPTGPDPPVRCKTPDSIIPVLPPEKLMSPNTLKNIANKVYEILENGDIEILDDDGPPPPVIPQKRPKKGEVPYIVGCKDRPRVESGRPKIRFGVGDTKYGVEECPCESSDDECQDCPKKRRRRGDGLTYSKSIFNPKSEEIAACLRANERLEPLFRKKSSSPDSCSTVSYECTVSPAPKSFSPIPSCSNDRETILKNEKLFSDSLICEEEFNGVENDVEIMEAPIETIDVIDETTIVEPKPDPVPENDDDFCMIVEPEKKSVSLIDLNEPKYDFYNNIDTFDLTENYEKDVCEIIDVDDIIAENQALINKYKKEENTRDVVTSVDLTNVSAGPEQNAVNDVVISSNKSASPVKNQTTPPVQVDNNQSTPSSSTTQSNTDEINTSKNRIADVVTNFFNRPTNNNDSEVIDLTSFQQSLINKITSLMSSLENFIRGRTTPRAQGDSHRQTIDDSVVEISSPGPSAPVGNNHMGPTLAASTNNNMFTSAQVSANNNNRGAGRKRPRGNARQRPAPPAVQEWIVAPPVQQQRAPPAVQQQPAPPAVQQWIVAPSVLQQRAPPPVQLWPAPPPVQQRPAPAVQQQTAAPVVVQQPAAPIVPQQAAARGIECPICMDSLSNQSIASTLCGHIFCMECLKTSIRANGKKCPTCRKALKGVGYHQLFL